MHLKIAAYLLVSLAIGMIAREFARAFVAIRVGDPTPRLWGRLSLDPRSWFEPFGSGLLPGLILILWAANASFLPPPFAYGKQAPVDPNRWRDPARDSVLISLAGPVSNLVLAILVGIPLRFAGSGEGSLILRAFLFTNLTLAVFHLMPVPGLDGARIVALFLPAKPREFYRNLDPYLPLFLLVIFFIFARPMLTIVNDLTGALCRAVAGVGC